MAPFSRFRFYTPEYLFEELENHKGKLQKASKLSVQVTKGLHAYSIDFPIFAGMNIKK
jgi:predicted nucleic acid-binding protein